MVTHPGTHTATPSTSSSPRRALGALGLGLPEEGRQSPFLPLGLPDFDARLGGLPRGRITEVLGPASAGKTTFMLEALARVSGARVSGSHASEGLAALIDLSGTIFPEAPWAERRLLVIRPRCVEDGLRALDALSSSAAFDLLAFESSGFSHPLPEAVAVRAARLSRETGSVLLVFGTAPIFGSSCALRLELSSTRDGRVRALVTKSRQGALGEEIALSAPAPAPAPTQGIVSPFPRRVA